MLTPNDFPSREALAERLLQFQSYYESIATPFQWRFTRADRDALQANTRDQPMPVAA